MQEWKVQNLYQQISKEWTQQRAKRSVKHNEENGPQWVEEEREREREREKERRSKAARVVI